MKHTQGELLRVFWLCGRIAGAEAGFSRAKNAKNAKTSPPHSPVAYLDSATRTRCRRSLTIGVAELRGGDRHGATYSRHEPPRPAPVTSPPAARRPRRPPPAQLPPCSPPAAAAPTSRIREPPFPALSPPPHAMRRPSPRPPTRRTPCAPSSAPAPHSSRRAPSPPVKILLFLLTARPTSSALLLATPHRTSRKGLITP